MNDTQTAGNKPKTVNLAPKLAQKLEFVKRHYPTYKGLLNYEELLSSNMHCGAVLLDGGCGAGNVALHKWLPDKINAIGVDVNLESLKRNTTYESLVLCDLEKLPFRNDTFDVITNCWVMEHLRNPDIVLAEFARTLKKGGALIILLPNLYNPVNFGAKFTPLWLHKLFHRIMSGRPEEEVWPTYFRCNTISSLDRKLKKIGFEREEVRMYGNWRLLSNLGKLGLRLWIILDRITNKGPLKGIKSNICVSYRKLADE